MRSVVRPWQAPRRLGPTLGSGKPLIYMAVPFRRCTNSVLSRLHGITQCCLFQIGTSRLEQDEVIIERFLQPWQVTLHSSIAVAMKARAAVRVSRLELDAAKQA
jgi:hypothetical protein